MSLVRSCSIRVLSDAVYSETLGRAAGVGRIPIPPIVRVGDGISGLSDEFIGLAVIAAIERFEFTATAELSNRLDQEVKQYGFKNYNHFDRSLYVFVYEEIDRYVCHPSKKYRTYGKGHLDPIYSSKNPIDVGRVVRQCARLCR